MNKITIEKINNGYILSWMEETEHGLKEEREVIEEDYDDEKEGMGKLLNRVAEFFGVSYDKWKDDNLKISWNGRGSKLE